MLKAREITQDTLPLTVRLGETDQEEPLILYRVPLPEGGDRCLGTPSTGRTWGIPGVQLMAATRHGLVYAVLRYMDGCAQLLAVYGSQERAQAWIDRQDDIPGHSYDIEEHVLDQDWLDAEGE